MSDAHDNVRRLAAIVFTDVAGYPARMQRDETGTLALVRADFDRMRALCEQHRGEVLKSTGDGLLLLLWERGPSGGLRAADPAGVWRQAGRRAATPHRHPPG